MIFHTFFVFLKQVLYPSYHLRSLSLWYCVYIPKTPCFVDCIEGDNFHSELHDDDFQNGDAEYSFSTTYIREKIQKSLKEEQLENNCNGMNGYIELNGCDNDEKDRSIAKNLQESCVNKDNDIIKNNNHSQEKTDNDSDDATDKVEENGFLSNEDSQSLTNIVELENDTKIVGEDGMQSSMTSSTKTITCDNNEIELQNLNLEDKNPNSEPSTPKGGRFKGHRRTHSTDSSPLKNVIKTASYSEGMTSSAFYSPQDNCEIQAPKVVNNPADNIRLIFKYLSHDGMLKCEDQIQQRLRDMHDEYRWEVRKWQKRFEMERQTRLAIANRKEDVQTDASSRRESESLDDMVSKVMIWYADMIKWKYKMVIE